MLIAICCTRNDINARFDRRFGRCPWFLLWDKEKMKGEFIPNDFGNSIDEQGVRVADMLAEKGVRRVFAADFGPHAEERLREHGIDMFLLRDDGVSLADILRIKGQKLHISGAQEKN